MIPSEWIPILRPVIRAFETLGIEYQIGGSLATSMWGVPRTTLDADIAVDLRLEQVAPLVALLKDEYYIDDQMIRDAILHHSTFNLLHATESYMKIDIFVQKFTPYDYETFARARLQRMAPNTEERAVFTSPEDIILRKLLWYQMGGGVSERQWSDVTNMLKLRANTLDHDYLENWAGQLGISDLLARALSDSGLS